MVEDRPGFRHRHLGWIEDRSLGLLLDCWCAAVPELCHVAGGIVDGRRISSAEQAMAPEAQGPAVGSVAVERVTGVAGHVVSAGEHGFVIEPAAERDLRG